MRFLSVLLLAASLINPIECSPLPKPDRLKRQAEVFHGHKARRMVWNTSSVTTNAITVQAIQITPLNPSTYYSTQEAITYQNTAGVPVATASPSIIEQTTFLPYSTQAVPSEPKTAIANPVTPSVIQSLPSANTANAAATTTTIIIATTTAPTRPHIDSSTAYLSWGSSSAYTIQSYPRFHTTAQSTQPYPTFRQTAVSPYRSPAILTSTVLPHTLGPAMTSPSILTKATTYSLGAGQASSSSSDLSPPSGTATTAPVTTQQTTFMTLRSSADYSLFSATTLTTAVPASQSPSSRVPLYSLVLSTTSSASEPSHSETPSATLASGQEAASTADGTTTAPSATWTLAAGGITVVPIDAAHISFITVTETVAMATTTVTTTATTTATA